MIQFCAAKSLSRSCLSRVQTEKTPALSNMLSALPSLATNEWTSWMVSKVPIADIEPKGCLVDISPAGRDQNSTEWHSIEHSPIG